MPIGVMVTLRRERMYEFFQQGIPFFICLRRGYKGNIHSENSSNTIDINFRENDLFLNTKGIVTLTIELTFNTLEFSE